MKLIFLLVGVANAATLLYPLGVFTGNIGSLETLSTACAENKYLAACTNERPFLVFEDESLLDPSDFPYSSTEIILDTSGNTIAIGWTSEGLQNIVFPYPIWSGMNPQTLQASAYTCNNWQSNSTCLGGGGGGSVSYYSMNNYLADCSSSYLVLCVCKSVSTAPTHSPTTSVPTDGPVTPEPTFAPSRTPTESHPSRSPSRTPSLPTFSPTININTISEESGFLSAVAYGYQTCLAFNQATSFVVCYGEAVGKPAWSSPPLPAGTTISMLEVSQGGGCVSNTINPLYCWGQMYVSIGGEVEVNSDYFDSYFPHDDQYTEVVRYEHKFLTVYWDDYGDTSPMAEFALGDNSGIALLHNREVYFWGNNQQLQGGGEDDDGGARNQMLMLLGPLNTPVGICAGRQFNCYIGNDPDLYAGTDSTVECFGSNSHGQVGGPLQTHSIQGGWDVFTGSYSYSAAPYYVDVVCGSYFYCVLFSNQSVSCQGDNSYMQFGSSSLTAASYSTLRLSFLSTFSGNIIAVYAGGDVACVVLSNTFIDRTFCFGDNTYGQLGIGFTGGSQNLVNPQAVVGMTSRNVKTITFGYSHTCIVDTNNAVSCFGDNTYGQLGVPGEKYDAILP